MLALALAVMLVALPILSLNGCALFAQSDQQAITDDAAKIAACQSAGLACQNSAPDSGQHDCFGVYDRCMQDAGLRQ